MGLLILLVLLIRNSLAKIVPNLMSFSSALSSITSSNNWILINGNIPFTVPSNSVVQVLPYINISTSFSTIDGTLILSNGSNWSTNGVTVNGSLSTSGATLNFGNGTSLTINGSVDCERTTFTGNYPGSWNGINIYSGSWT